MDGAVTQMCYAGDLLVSEDREVRKRLWYRYDSSGNVIALTHERSEILYVRGDRPEMPRMTSSVFFDKDGKAVVRYTWMTAGDR